MYNALEMKLLGSYQRKTLCKVESHLVAKTADRAYTRTVELLNTLVQYMLQQIEVLLHGCKVSQKSKFKCQKSKVLVIRCNYF